MNHREYAAIRVGFKRFLYRQCVFMVLYVGFFKAFLLAICDNAAIRVGFIRCSVGSAE